MYKWDIMENDKIYATFTKEEFQDFVAKVAFFSRYTDTPKSLKALKERTDDVAFMEKATIREIKKRFPEINFFIDIL